MLGLAVVKGTTRVSISIILAVNYSALHSILNLKGRQRICGFVNVVCLIGCKLTKFDPNTCFF